MLKDLTRQDNSYYFGRFMGKLHGIEQGLGTGILSMERGQDYLLLLEVNFISTVQMSLASVRNFPNAVSYLGNVLTLEQLKEASQRLNVPELTGEQLDTSAFLQGYEELVDYFMQSAGE